MPAWRYPFLWAASGLIFGILLSETTTLYAILGIGALIVVVSYAWFRLKWGRLVWSLPLFAILGWGRAWIERSSTAPDRVMPLVGQLVRLSGYVIEEPLRTKKAYRLLIHADSIFLYRTKQAYPLDAKVLLYVRDSAALRMLPGQCVSAGLRLDSVRFGRAYWTQQGVFLSGFSEKVEAGSVEWRYVRGYFQRWRYYLVQKMQVSAPTQGAPLSVIQALLLGYKRGIDPEVREAFQLSGTAHILAVSGMHVGLVLSLWIFLLGKLPAGWGRHWVSQSALVILVVLYGFLTGASPSAMRAVIMGSVAIVARMLWQKYTPLNALGFAAFLQSAADPMVIYNLGFQLSYAAVGGIMAFYTPIRTLLLRSSRREKALLSYTKDILAISIAAQAGTLFLSWAYFGRFPAYFLIANLLAVPLATGVAFAAVGWIALIGVPWVGTLAAYPAYGLAWLLIESVRLLAKLPGGSIELPALPAYLGVVLSLLVIVGGGVWLKRYTTQEKAPWLV